MVEIEMLIISKIILLWMEWLVGFLMGNLKCCIIKEIWIRLDNV